MTSSFVSETAGALHRARAERAARLRIQALPPGPRLIPYLRVIALARDPLGFLMRSQRLYGEVFTLPFGSALPKNAWVCDPALAQQVLLASDEELEAANANAIVQPIVGSNSLLLLAGEQHAARRQLVWLEFAHGPLLSDERIVAEEAAAELAAWKPGRELELWAVLRKLTLRIMLRVVFGTTPPERLEKLTGAVEETLALAGSLPMLMPVLRRNLGPRSPWGRFLRAKERVDRLLHREIGSRRVDPGSRSGTDILSFLVNAVYPDGSTLSDNAIRDELMTLLVAGSRTTAGGLAWTLDLLLRNPVALAAARADAAGGRYLSAAVWEAMRLRPPLFAVGRRAVRDYPLGRFLIPAGMGVVVPLLAVFRSPRAFEAPTLYRPERFLEKDPPQWMPFGEGIRSCLGRRLAERQIPTLLNAILETVDLELTDPASQRLALQAGSLLVPGEEVRVRVLSRS